MNSVDDLTEECLGYAGLVYEHVLVSVNQGDYRIILFPAKCLLDSCFLLVHHISLRLTL